MTSTTSDRRAEADTAPSIQRIGLPEARSRWVLLRCYRYLGKYAALVVGEYGAAIVIILLTLFIPQLIRQTVDVGMRQQNREVLWLSVLGMLGLMLLKGILIFF